MIAKLNSCQRIFIIGNADDSDPIDHILTEKDCIVRFNKPNPSCPIKADMLIIANGPRMVIRKTELFNNLLHEHCNIIWRYSINDILTSRYEKISLSRKIRYPLFFYKFKRLNKFDHYPTSFYDQSMQIKCTSLMNGSIPSTGFLAIYMLKIQYPDIPIYLHNFTFQGWEGHNWNKEEEIIGEWLNTQQIFLASSIIQNQGN